MLDDINSENLRKRYDSLCRLFGSEFWWRQGIPLGEMDEFQWNEGPLAVLMVSFQHVCAARLKKPDHYARKSRSSDLDLVVFLEVLYDRHIVWRTAVFALKLKKDIFCTFIRDGQNRL